jgi:pimeloyl-ACP methyl ester carboxylesterase
VKRVRPLPVIECGAGEPIVLLSGGPGFSPGYLLDASRALESEFKLVAIAPGEDHKCWMPAEIAMTLASHSRDGLIRVIAHSWGVVRLLSALQLLPEIRSIGLLVAPAPVTWAQFQTMQERFLSSLPQSVVAWLMDPETNRLDASQISQLLPHYISRHARYQPTNIEFDFASYRQELAAYAGFDLRDCLPQIAGCKTLLGADDFIELEDIGEIYRGTAGVEIIPEAGHFPICEQHDHFIALARTIFRGIGKEVLR